MHRHSLTGISLWHTHTHPDAAFVLVAGGLGERLGYKGIKVALPTNTATMECYMSMYIRQILALQAMSNAASGASRVVPLAIMTSGDTHDKTVQLLKDNANFGMAADQVLVECSVSS